LIGVNGQEEEKMNPACDLLRSGKPLFRGLAALLVLAAVVSTAAAQITIQPGEVLTYSFGPDDVFNVLRGINNRTGLGPNGTDLSLGSETALVPGHKAGSFALTFWGDDTGGVQGFGTILWAGTGIYTNTDTHTLGLDTGPFTCMAWVNRGSYKGDNMLFGTVYVPAMHQGFRGNKPYQGFWNNDNTGAPIDNPPVGSWHHIAYRYDPSILEQDIFVDGVNVSTAGNAQPYGQDQSFLIGRTVPNSGAYAGLLEYPRIFNVALTDAQIAAAAADQF
jgi:hypothetical protein